MARARNRLRAAPQRARLVGKTIYETIITYKNKKMKKSFISVLLLVSCGLVPTACTDDSYDLGQDIDLTMQLGSEGLAVKLGNTERIYMRDILEVEDDNNLDTTRTGLYYVEQGDVTDFEFSVDPVTTAIDKAQLKPEVKDVVTFDKIVGQLGVPSTGTSVPVPALTFQLQDVQAVSEHHVRLTDISPSVKSIKRVVPDNEYVRLRMEIIQESLGGHFRIDEIRNLVITLPDYLKCAQANGQQLEMGDFTGGGSSIDLGRVLVDRVEFEGELGQPFDGTHFTLDGELSMKCDMKLSTDGSFTAKDGDHVNVQLVFDVGDANGVIEIAEATGVYDPEIEPDVEPIAIGNFLPEFLQDKDVTIDVDNPTVRFETDMTGIPASFEFQASLTSRKDGTPVSTVRLPDSGMASLSKGRDNLLYFYQGTEPFNPHGVEGGTHYAIPELASLIEKLPDDITVDLGNGNARLRQGELNTIKFDHTYGARVSYDLFIPFRFGSGLKIVYTDSITDLNSDLKDLEADGLLLTATILNTVPLVLDATLVPLDTDDNEIPGIEVTPARIAAGTESGVETPIGISVKLKNRADLKRLDKIMFNVTAAADGSDILASNQYLQVRDLRLKLTGPVIADLND